MIDKDQVLRVVSIKGPLIPNHLKKEIGGDTLFLGAVLSELAANGKIKITHMKIGGSPIYYTPGTENRLQNFVKYLNEKDRATVELLSKKKIVKDTEVSPLERVSLRNIRDFAKPLEVDIKGKKEIFWKWYLLSGSEAKEIIMKLIAPPPQPTPKPVPVKETKKAVEVKPKVEKKEKIKKKPDIEKEIVIESIQKPLPINKDALEQEKDPFFKQIIEYFKKHDIEVIEFSIVRKNTESEFIISVPSRIGFQEYYCKAKSKKKINDGDLSTGYIQGQLKKLPVLFITVGEMTKKAKEMINKEFKGMIVKKI